MKKIMKFIAVLIVIVLAVIGMITTILYLGTGNSSNNAGIQVTANENKKEEMNKPVNDGSSSVYYSGPFSIKGTHIKILKINLKYGGSSLKTYSRVGLYKENLVNVLFYDSSKQYEKLLLNRKALIQKMDYPSFTNDTLRKIILYQAILQDTDEDGQLSEKDNSILLISDLNGLNLKEVTNSKTDFNSYKYI